MDSAIVTEPKTGDNPCGCGTTHPYHGLRYTRSHPTHLGVWASNSPLRREGTQGELTAPRIVNGLLEQTRRLLRRVEP